MWRRTLPHLSKRSIAEKSALPCKALGGYARQPTIRLTKLDMSKLTDLAGQRFGRLTVLHRAGKEYPVRWAVGCDCGTEKTVSRRRLLDGSVKSCGCLRRELTVARNKKRTKPFELVARKNVLCHYIQNASARGLEWGLSEKHFYTLIQKPCFWCGALPANQCKISYRKGVFIYQGVDRLDNRFGYSETNAVPCCYLCNDMKSSTSAHDFKHQVEKISHNLKGHQWPTTS